MQISREIFENGGFGYADNLEVGHCTLHPVDEIIVSLLEVGRADKYL